LPGGSNAIGSGPGWDFDPDPHWGTSPTQRKTIFPGSLGGVIYNGHWDEVLTDENFLGDTLQLVVDTVQAIRITSVDWGRRKEFVFNEFMPDYTDLPYATPIGLDGQPLPLDGKPRQVANTDFSVGGVSFWHLKSFPMVGIQIAQMRSCSPYILVTVPYKFDLSPDYTKAELIQQGTSDVNVPIDIPLPDFTLPPPYRNDPPHDDSWSPYMGKATLAVIDMSFDQWKKSVGV
jgi:hypothetical protein